MLLGKRQHVGTELLAPRKEASMLESLPASEVHDINRFIEDSASELIRWHGLKQSSVARPGCFAGSGFATATQRSKFGPLCKASAAARHGWKAPTPDGAAPV
jgi:hypothetical protein